MISGCHLYVLILYNEKKEKKTKKSFLTFLQHKQHPSFTLWLNVYDKCPGGPCERPLSVTYGKDMFSTRFVYFFNKIYKL